MTSPLTRRQAMEIGITGSALAFAPPVFAAGSDTLRIGLVGCGGRGTGAAAQALKADRNISLTAMADAFSDRLEFSLDNLAKDQDLTKKIQVPATRRFTGFDAYKRLLEHCDVVLLCTTPCFRPMHLRAAIEAGKHVFAEKPVAVDAPGVRSVLESCALAKSKKLSVVSGLCLRYHFGFQEMVSRLRSGAIGELICLEANDYRGGRWNKPRQPGWSDMMYQMRNWYNFTWLSGDFNVEQHVHFLDVCAWIMGDEYPVKAMGLGGRQVLTETHYGNIYDHFSIIYEYANGVKLISNCRQQHGCRNDMSAHAHGSKGRAHLVEKAKGLVIRGQKDWVYEGPNNDIYQTEHDVFFDSIRKGQPVNNGDYMAKSTLLAIMGRMAAYTGQQITWDMALNSKEDLSPPNFQWEGKLPDPTVAMPGKTKFF